MSRLAKLHVLKQTNGKFPVKNCNFQRKIEYSHSISAISEISNKNAVEQVVGRFCTLKNEFNHFAPQPSFFCLALYSARFWGANSKKERKTSADKKRTNKKKYFFRVNNSYYGPLHFLR